MISLLVWLTIIGFLTYIATTFIPMPGQIKTLIVIVAVIFCVLLVLQGFGVLSGSEPRLPRINWEQT